MSYNRGIIRQRCDIRDIKSICETTRLSTSWMRSGTLSLVKARLGFSTLIAIAKKMGF